MKKSLASSFFPNIRDEMGEKTSHLIISYTTNTDGNILWVKITPKILIFQPISSSYFRKIWAISDFLGFSNTVLASLKEA